jgi:trans-aconitate methyltransferase
MERLWSDAEDAYRAEILNALDSQPANRLLDVGCDDGTWTEVVRGKLHLEPDQVSGLELVVERVERARARGFDVRIGDLDERWPARRLRLSVPRISPAGTTSQRSFSASSRSP